MALPLAVMATPGRAAKLSSTTWPWMVPVEPAAPCAKAGPADRRVTRARNATFPFLILDLRSELVADPEADDARIEEGDDFLEALDLGGVVHGGDPEVRHRLRVERIEYVEHGRHPSQPRELDRLLQTEVEDAHVGRAIGVDGLGQYRLRPRAGQGHAEGARPVVSALQL